MGRPQPFVSDFLETFSSLDIGVDGATYIIAEDYYIFGEITVPEGVTLKFVRGGMLHLHRSTSKVMINGTLEAGPFQIFNVTSGIGVYFGPASVHQVFPEWWGVSCSPNSDDQPAFQQAVDSGAKEVKVLPRHYYFSRPLKITHNSTRLIGSGMVSGTVIEANEGFSGAGYDASSIIILDDGVDYVEIGHLGLVAGTSTAQAYSDYGVYAKGDKGSSHQEIHIHHLHVMRMREWGMAISCHLSTFEHIRIGISNGILVGEHIDDVSTVGTTITLNNCYVVQNAQSDGKKAYSIDTVSGFTALGCAADHCDVVWEIDNSIGQIVGSYGEHNRQILSQDGVSSNISMDGCEWYNIGDDNSAINPVESIFFYYGRLSLRNTTVSLNEAGQGDAYNYFFKETASTEQLTLESLRVRLIGGGYVDPINDKVNTPSSLSAKAVHLHSERDPSALLTLELDQSIDTSNPTKMAFGQEVYDLQGNADTTEGEFDIVNSCRGIYEFEAQVTLADVAADTAGVIRIYQEESGNPDILIGQATVTTATSADMVLHLRVTHKAGANRSYYVEVEHSHGSSRDAKAGEAYTYFRMRRIAPYVGM
ncbi:hypothetical protein H8E77_03830 [bacterium]|nr:hypothetical protein [bacterium]